MSKLTKHKMPPRFDCLRSFDGDDETFDIVCLTTDLVIASLPFWEDERLVKREAKMMVAALNKFFDREGYFLGDSLLKSIVANSSDRYRWLIECMLETTKP